jgi:hypothetical protein
MFPIIGLTGLIPFAGRMMDLLQNIKDVSKKWQDLHTEKPHDAAVREQQLEAQRQQIIADFNGMLTQYHDTMRQMMAYHDSSDAQKETAFRQLLDQQARAGEAHEATLRTILAYQAGSEHDREETLRRMLTHLDNSDRERALTDRDREATMRDMLHFTGAIVGLVLDQNQASVRQMVERMQKVMGQLQQGLAVPALPLDQQETVPLALPAPPLDATVAEAEEAFDTLKEPLIAQADPTIAHSDLEDLGVVVRWECSFSDDFITTSAGVAYDASRVFVLIVNRVTMHYYVVAACGRNDLTADVRAYRNTLDVVPSADSSAAWQTLVQEAQARFDVFEPPFVTVPDRGTSHLIKRLQRNELFRAQGV